MSEDEELHRLEQAWKYASGDVRRTFLMARYREQGAAGESTIQIMGQVNASDLAPSVQMAWEGRVVQWTPDEVIRHAFNILEVTVGAEGDAFLMGPNLAKLKISAKSRLGRLCQR